MKFKKIITGCALISAVLLAPGSGPRAQQTSDVVSRSEPDPGDSVSAKDDAPVDVPVVPAGGLTFGERFKIYWESFIHPQSVIGPALSAGIGQWQDTPHEWGQGGDGYGLRFASGYGRSVIARTIAFGVAAADREDDRYFPLNEGGIWRRTRHAVVGTFVSRTPSGGTMPAISRFAGVYSAAFISNAWEPRSQNSTADALERGSTALLSSVGWHVFEEFWPDIKKALHHGH
jgi:hypothetical protein